MENEQLPIETHPWAPYIHENARILIMGTFPPAPTRWCMDFYYPNRTNDFWYMMGVIFFGDRHALYDAANKTFRLDDIKNLLDRKGIAINDTAWAVRRLKGNASDKYLEIVKPVPLFELLTKMPNCHTLAATGEKAAGVLAELTDSQAPAMGTMTTTSGGLEIWRMPSTSRAYPLPLEKKAEYYATMFRHCGIIAR